MTAFAMTRTDLQACEASQQTLLDCRRACHCIPKGWSHAAKRRRNRTDSLAVGANVPRG